MKKFFLSSLLLLSLFNLNFAQAARSKQAAPKNAPKAAAVAPKQAAPVPFYNKTLSNGLEVIVYPDSGVPLVTVELAVRNGSFTEPPELNGLSHLYEHMFFKTNQAVRLLQCEYLASSGGSNPVCGDALRL